MDEGLFLTDDSRIYFTPEVAQSTKLFEKKPHLNHTSDCFCHLYRSNSMCFPVLASFTVASMAKSSEHFLYIRTQFIFSSIISVLVIDVWKQVGRTDICALTLTFRGRLRSGQQTFVALSKTEKPQGDGFLGSELGAKTCFRYLLFVRLGYFSFIVRSHRIFPTSMN